MIAAISAKAYEAHWIAFHAYSDEALWNCKQQFEETQPHLHAYLLSLDLNESAKAILFFVGLSVWDFLSAEIGLNLAPVPSVKILQYERLNAQGFQVLEHTDEFSESLVALLTDYPQKDLFTYLGHIISTRALGREDQAITTDQRGWMILYLKVLVDCMCE